MKNIFNLTIVVLIIVLIVSLKTCSFTKADELKTTIVKDTVAYYTNNLNIQTATINTLQLTRQQLQRDLLEKDLKIKALIKEFVKIKSIVNYKAVTVVDTITVAYKDTVPYFFERSGHIKNEWYTFKYTNDNKGFQIDSLSIPTNAIIITGVKRKWFLGKQKITTDITNTNPFVSIKNIQSVEITTPEPWYKKWYVWLAGGIAGGVILSQ